MLPPTQILGVSKQLRQFPWMFPLLYPRSGYCSATCAGVLSVQICAMKYSGDLCLEKGRRDVGEAE